MVKSRKPKVVHVSDFRLSAFAVQAFDYFVALMVRPERVEPMRDQSRSNAE